MKDNFSKQSALYAKYRPGYPKDLFDFITGFLKDKSIAWDCATGNGQSAVQLANYFKKVVATDISEKQLKQAEKKDNIFYSIASAEASGMEDGSINLITVAQAIHWFDFEKFYQEVRRVAAPEAYLAVWCYSLLRINPSIDKLIEEYHFNTLGAYWDAERKYVDEGYASIPFPFEKKPAPNFEIVMHWTLDELQGYLNTWSALQKFMSSNNDNPVQPLINSIETFWPTGETKKIIFPIHLLMGAIK